ncbi:MAG: MFS transporter [Chloroflexi bacterium]|nr:MFS transporter [Chloroflexota bacterium]
MFASYLPEASIGKLVDSVVLEEQRHMSQVQPQVATEAEVYPRYRWVMVSLLILAQEIAVLLPMGMLLPSMRKDLGFGIAQGGLLSSMMQLASVLLAIPFSLLLVRFSPRWVYLVALLLASVASFIAGRAISLVTLLIPYFAMGIAGAMRQVPDTLLKLQWVPKHEFGRVMGMTTGMTTVGQSLAVISVPFLLIILGGWRGMLSLFSIGMFTVAVIWLILGRQRITPTYRDGMSKGNRASLKSIIKRKEIIMLAMAVFGLAVAYMSFQLFLPTFLLEQRGIPLTTVGFIVSLLPIGGTCGSLASGFISDKIGLRKPAIWPQGFVLPLLFFTAVSPVPIWILPVLMFILGFVAWSSFAVMRIIPFELPGMKPSEVAVGQSVFQMMMTLGGVIGMPLVGRIAESIGLGRSLYIAGFLSLTVAIMGLLIPETGPKAAAKKAGEAATEISLQ